MKNYSSAVLVFFVSAIITITGVMAFFKPVAESDNTVLVLPPFVGLIYIMICSAIYIWAYKEIGNSYKAALVLVLPQAALIVDLMLRGDRGPAAALAGVALLLITWFTTAFIHKRYIKT